MSYVKERIVDCTRELKQKKNIMNVKIGQINWGEMWQIAQDTKAVIKLYV